MTDTDAKVCCRCGRRWRGRSRRRYTALGLRLRRAARHAGVRVAWAHPRPLDRCPSCTSRSVTAARIGLSAVPVEPPEPVQRER